MKGHYAAKSVIVFVQVCVCVYWGSVGVCAKERERDLRKREKNERDKKESEWNSWSPCCGYRLGYK